MARATGMGLSTGISTGIATGIATGMARAMTNRGFCKFVLLLVDGIPLPFCIGHRRNVEFRGERNTKHIANAKGFIQNLEWFSGSVEIFRPTVQGLWALKFSYFFRRKNPIALP